MGTDAQKKYNKIKDSEFTTPWKGITFSWSANTLLFFSHLLISVCKCDTLGDSYSTEAVSPAHLPDMFSLPSQPLGHLCPFFFFFFPEAMTQMSFMCIWCIPILSSKPFPCGHCTLGHSLHLSKLWLQYYSYHTANLNTHRIPPEITFKKINKLQALSGK